MGAKRGIAWESSPCVAHRSDLEYALSRFGATEFRYAQVRDVETGLDYGRFGFLMRDGKEYQMDFLLPIPEAAEFTRIGEMHGNTSYAAERTAREAYNRAVAHTWRTFLIWLKEKLLACEMFGFSQEFLPYLVMPSGVTLAEWVQPTVERMFQARRVVPPARPKKKGAKR